MPDKPDPFSSPKPGRPAHIWIAGLALAALAAIGLGQVFGGPAPRDGTQPLPTPVAATAPAVPDTDPMDVWVDWDTNQGATDRRIGGYRIEVSSGLDADGLHVSRIRLTDTAGATTEIVGAGAGYGANAAFAVTRLDASDTVSQVLVSTFTGGAHCCSVLTVVESRDGAWRTFDLGSWDGDTPAMPRDLDDDGVKEFRFVDQAFLYTFASYAESWAPPVIHKLVDGRIRDVSKAAAYRSVFEQAAAGSRIACLERSNGACAAYVASAARAGRLEAAWAEMLDAYDQASDWTLPTACRIRTSGSCPTGAEMTFSTYPEALQWFLGEQGYTRRVYIAPLNATGPSFDCAAARTISEQAICRSSDLAVLDRTLAVAYSRAMALARDRAALRATQRSFHRAKRDEGDIARLSALYEMRIGELLAVD
jgi:hypothetical protein